MSFHAREWPPVPDREMFGETGVTGYNGCRVEPGDSRRARRVFWITLGTTYGVAHIVLCAVFALCQGLLTPGKHWGWFIIFIFPIAFPVALWVAGKKLQRAGLSLVSRHRLVFSTLRLVPTANHEFRVISRRGAVITSSILLATVCGCAWAISRSTHLNEKLILGVGCLIPLYFLVVTSRFHVFLNWPSLGFGPQGFVCVEGWGNQMRLDEVGRIELTHGRTLIGDPVIYRLDVFDQRLRRIIHASTVGAGKPTQVLALIDALQASFILESSTTPPSGRL